MVFPDRSPHPALFEVAHVHQPLAATLASTEGRQVAVQVASAGSAPPTIVGHLSLQNRYDCATLERLTVTCALEIDGVQAGSAVLDAAALRAIAPGSTADVPFALPLPAAASAYTDALLVVRGRLVEGTPVLPAGHEVAFMISWRCQLRRCRNQRGCMAAEERRSLGDWLSSWAYKDGHAVCAPGLTSRLGLSSWPARYPHTAAK